MKIFRGIAIFLLLAMAPMLSTAEEKPKQALNIWVDCGIGAMLFTETGWAAVISNVIWDWGITATTSHQSSPDQCGSKKATTAMYIGATYANLVEETTKGGGKHLHAMLDIMGCDSASHGGIIASLRTEFSQYLRNSDYAAKATLAQAEDYNNIVQTIISEGYTQQCRTI
jgi:hypothetical protein